MEIHLIKTTRKALILLFFMCFYCYNVFAQLDQTEYEKAIQRKEYRFALKHIREQISNTKEPDADLYYKRAIAYEGIGKYIYAISDCTSALKYNPNDEKAYLLRGKCKIKMGDPTYIKDLQKGGKEGIAMLKKLGKEPTTTTPQNDIEIISDVDTDIPAMGGNTNNKTFVVIIANEKYLENNISQVCYAQKDGDVFKQYCIKTLGIPAENIHVRNNATRNQMRSEMKWLNNIANAFGEKSNIIVYYSGHGMPDEENQKAYLLPSDGIANDPESAYSLESFYNQLGALNVNSIVVFLDACFSGFQRDGGMLTATKGVAIKPKEEKLNGNVIVISASKGDETAYPYQEKGHGLFTYYLLKKLQSSKGDITLKELGNYIIDNVKQTSMRKNSKIQTPTIYASEHKSEYLYNLKLRNNK